MTFPLQLAYDARTAVILEGMNERVPGLPRDLPDMMRDIALRRTLLHSQTALALISIHPHEPAPDMVVLARYAIAQCGGRLEDAGAELPSVQAETIAEEWHAIYRRVLAVMLGDANTSYLPNIETVEASALPSVCPKADGQKTTHPSHPDWPTGEAEAGRKRNGSFREGT